jgi:hypothetical protein
MVLRFLAEDVGLGLGEVLDAILRAEEHQRQSRPFRSGTFSEQSPKRNPDRTS